MDAAARPGRQPLLLAPLLPETIYGCIDMGFRTLVMGISIGGGMSPGVTNAILSAFEAAIADLRRQAEEALKLEAEARGQLQTAMSMLSDCMQELDLQKCWYGHLGPDAEK